MHVLTISSFAYWSSLTTLGSIAVRNTPWARHFLQVWWGDAEQRRNHWDQHIFTKLYSDSSFAFSGDSNDMFSSSSKGLNNMASHIALLPADAFNTRRPATMYHHSQCPALHMVGALGLHRQAVFKFGWEELCRDSIGVSHATDKEVVAPVAPQLGLDKQRLITIEKLVLASRFQRAEALVNLLTSTPPEKLASYGDLTTITDNSEGRQQYSIKQQYEIMMKLGDPREGGVHGEVSMVLQAMKHYYKVSASHSALKSYSSYL